MDRPLLLTILAIAALLLMSGIFSGSETALTAASKARMKRLASEGKRRAKMVSKLIDDQERFLGAILLGNNLVNILASALATSVMISLFGENGVIWATLIMTAMVLIFSEVLPKTVAISNPDRIALIVAPFISFVIKVLSPFVVLVRWIVRGTLSLFGTDLTNSDHILSPHEEIRGAIDLHESEGGIRKSDRDMLGGILDLDTVTVEDIMVHRKNMIMANIDQDPQKLIERLVKSPFTRIPLWQGNKENVVGVVHAKDLLRALNRPGVRPERLNIRRIMKRPWFVPETSTLREQLNGFLDNKKHFALVVDEYGALMGLVTLEDVLEEIVGEIADEHDFDGEGIKVLDNGAVMVDGTVTVRDLNRQFDWRLPDVDATTIAGLVINEAAVIPIVGDSFRLFGFDFQIIGRHKNQITKIRIRVPKARTKKDGADH